MVSNDQELVQSEPQPYPRNQNGKEPKLLVDIIQRKNIWLTVREALSQKVVIQPLKPTY